MKVSYYPGCSLHGTAKEYDESTQMVCEELGVELEEVNDWNCCGASSAHCTNDKLSVALGARVLALAEKADSKTLAAADKRKRKIRNRDSLPHRDVLHRDS